MSRNSKAGMSGAATEQYIAVAHSWGEALSQSAAEKGSQARIDDFEPLRTAMFLYRRECLG